jgi:glycosyltransferase involved in cell wall biosynthesis
MLTVVIPTRNRPADLTNAIKSLCYQSRLPDELIVVDQSVDDLSIRIVKSLIAPLKKIKLLYIHDSNIFGLVEAKRVAVKNASGQIIFFLEDDIVLEADYIRQIELGFLKQPNMIGCCGVITNPPKVGFLYKFLFKIFHRGIFKDKRIEVHGNFSGFNNNLKQSNMLSGGVSAWRREVFDNVEFDVANGFHMFEDIDFSTRVARHFGNRLFINPNARLAHYCSRINRDLLGARERRKLTECFTYYKKRKDWPNAAISFYWLLLGMLLEAMLQSFSCVSFKPIHGYILGLQDGYAKKIIS